jgi:hypothetical protein
MRRYALFVALAGARECFASGTGLITAQWRVPSRRTRTQDSRSALYGERDCVRHASPDQRRAT